MYAKALVTALALVAIPVIAQESSQAAPSIKTIKLSEETLALDAVLLRDVRESAFTPGHGHLSLSPIAY